MTATSGHVQLRATILSWEKLRLLFNLTLLVEGLVLSYDLIEPFGGVLPWAFWIVVFGLTANAWFCFGPLLEIYLIVFRGNGMGKGRYLLFGFGLLTGMLVVLYLAMMTALATRHFFKE